jgi:hypothetical protein
MDTETLDMDLIGCQQPDRLKIMIKKLLTIMAAVLISAITLQAQLRNTSTRGMVGLGQDQLIGGFILDQTATVIIRGIGPSLTQYGVEGILQDPILELYDSNSYLIALNDDWQHPQFFSQPQDFGPLAPTNEFEAAIKVTLPAGNYTFILTGFGLCTGRGLVEVYLQ